MSVSPFTLSFPCASVAEANRYVRDLVTDSRDASRIAETFSPHK